MELFLLEIYIKNKGGKYEKISPFDKLLELKLIKKRDYEIDKYHPYYSRGYNVTKEDIVKKKC